MTDLDKYKLTQIILYLQELSSQDIEDDESETQRHKKIEKLKSKNISQTPISKNNMSKIDCNNSIKYEKSIKMAQS